ncbi:MAG: hypothetical protein P9L94_01055 [Candidatus Hinthialibacter antarcticus]|nr:hypothetical protein [Candidatus Hinthialibacter antarcticus]
MPQLLIDLTNDQHERIKALADLEGKSVSEYVLDCSMTPDSDDAALHQIKSLLQPRIEQAGRGDLSDKTFEDIKRECRDTLTDK